MNQRTRSCSNSNSERNATWQMMQYLSCSSPVVPAPTTTNNHLFINSTIPTTTVVRRRTMDPKLIKPPPQDLSISIGPHYPSPHDLISQTLELFPLRSGGVNDQNGSSQKENEITIEAMNGTNLSAPACQFFEFLPLKN
ncbi:hypothetical protein LguiA_027860 [Lonicera macranthoides]